MKTEIKQEIDTDLNHACITFQNTPAMELILKNVLNAEIPYWLWKKLQSQKRLDDIQFRKILNELFTNKWDISDEFVSVQV